MKKRILGLALALVLVISLLPLTALAASPMPKFRMFDPAYGNYLESYFNQSKTVYVVYENVLDTDNVTVLGNKPVIASEVPTDNYIKYEFDGTTATITMKNVNYKRTASAGNFMYILKNGSNYTNEFPIVLTLEGTNTIEGIGASFLFANAGGVTINGSGSLTANVSLGSKTFIQSQNAGDMLIKDVTMTTVISNTNAGGIGTLTVNGAITFDNATINMSGMGWDTDAAAPSTPEKAKLTVICTGTAYSTENADTTKGVTFKNGSNITISGGGSYAVKTNGPITVENSNVTIAKGTGNNTPAVFSVPYATGCSEVKYGSKANTWKDIELASGTVLTDAQKFLFYKAVHTCTAQADDNDCTTAVTCVCGKEAVPAKQHIAGANADDCTKDTICGNTGCTQVFEAKKGDAHVAGQDDGDCTTDILCSNTGCTQVATKGAEKHVWDRANCDVAGTCTNTNCTKGIEAGTHSGGTATCKAKAKCAECGKEYGELGACAPAADDGDCTTAIKCTVCGKDTTAAKDAHKYTDKNDTTCDNAGCKNTRKVEGTENPKTGDNSAIAVVAALMVTAAAAFVTTKKFAR